METKDAVNQLEAQVNALNIKLTEKEQKIIDLTDQLTASRQLARTSAKAAASGLSKADLVEVAEKVRAGLSEDDAIEVVLLQRANDERSKQEQKKAGE